MRLKAVSVITALLSVGYAHFDSSLDDDQALAKRVNIAGGTELRILPLVRDSPCLLSSLLLLFGL